MEDLKKSSMGKDGEPLSMDDKKEVGGGEEKLENERKINKEGDVMKNDEAKGEEEDDVNKVEGVTKDDQGIKDISEEKEEDAGEESNKNDEAEKVVTILDENPKNWGENHEENDPSCNVDVSNSEDTNHFSDLKDSEKKSLVEFRSKVEEAINKNQLFTAAKGNDDDEEEEDEKTESTEETDIEKVKREHKDDIEMKLKDSSSFDDVNLWGVPLLYSKGGKATDVVLLKFLRAREFKVPEALDMLKSTLQWRKDNNIDSILEEDLGNEFHPTTYINGRDREGHPVCYNVYGVLDSDDMYNKTLGTEASRDKFVRWRIQLMEAGIRKLDFNNDVSCLLQIHDLQSTPGPSKKEVRITMKQVVNIFQENYPEFVAKNIFINVPFWYYAVTALVSPFLTQRTKSKSIYARPSKVIETLLKYIGAEEIPICYGGLKRDSDSESFGDAEEVSIKANSIETIEIPMPQVGSCVTWELVVSGWEVNYKEEFVPDEETSYTIMVQKEKKMGSNEHPIRNSYKNNEPGKIVLIIVNAPFKTKKRAFYRYTITSP